MELAQRVQRIKPSPTLAVAARANQLKAAGKDIINLGVGEPDFDTPEHVKEAAIKAIKDGFTKYTAVDGIPALKQAICDKFQKENQLAYTPAQILVSCGCKQSFYNLAQALLNEGDEVLIPAPYWVSYPDMVLLADGKPVIIPTDFKQGFKVTAAQLQASITPKTRLLVLNSPSNPTGIAYSAKELHAIAEVLLKHPQVMVVSDDIYERILWSQSFSNILNVCPELYERTVVLNGVSKTYAMTGWRIGYAAGPKALITAMTNIQSQSTSNPTSIAQIAAVAAINGEQSCVTEMVKAYQSRHQYLYQALQAMPGVKVHPADGTFYSFPDINEALLKGEDDLQFAEKLLNETGIALVPGSAFGSPGCIRLSFATSQANLEKAMQRLGDFLKQRR